MKLKRNALWALLAGLLIALAGAWMPISVMLFFEPSAETAIIGGAGAPTQMFLLQRSPIWGILLIGLVALVTCIVTGVMLLIPDKNS